MGFLSSIGNFIGGVGKTVAGVLGIGSQKAANRANVDFARQQLEYQKELAKNQIQWRVDDAKKAGLHPMAALGLNSTSFSPVTLSQQGIDYSSIADGISDMGQSLNYASTKAKDSQQQQVAFRLAQEGVELQNEGLRLDNEYKRWQILQAMETGTSQALRSPAAPSTSENRLIPGQGDSPAPVRKADTVDSGDSKYQFLRQPNGSYALVPGNDWSQVYEDKGLFLEQYPIVNTMVTDYYNRATGGVIDGMVYSDSLHGWVPVDSKEGRAVKDSLSGIARRHLSDVIDFYSRYND